jgi:thiol-disulfide isomerase/thioredoxin
MKIKIQILLGCLLAASASAEFRTWTRNDGKTAELDLVSVSDSAGEKSGEFKMRNGKTVTLKASSLTEADAKLLAEWKPAATTSTTSAAASVFDEILDGNLVKLDGKSLKAFKDLKKPAKYYVFYYTASWCGPCQQFTPSLVDFYQKNKNDNFELVLITSDQEEGDMEDYAASKRMHWPQLKIKKADDFKKKFAHGVRGIPSVIVCDLEGKIITSNGRDLNALGTLLK